MNTYPSQLEILRHIADECAYIPEEEHIALNPEQKKELDKRLAEHKAGKLKYFTLDEVREAVLKNLQK